MIEPMPVELYDADEFVEQSKNAVECRVIRKGEVVKLKLRSKKYLYTLKTSPNEAEKVLSRITCPIREA